MARRFTQPYLDSLKPTEKAYWKTDGGRKGLVIKIQTNGRKFFYFIRQRGASGVPLGEYPEVTIQLAREECGRVLERIARGEDPKPLYRRPVPKQAENPTLNELFKRYAKWFREDRAANGYDSRGLEVIVTALKDLGDMRVANVTARNVEDWRNKLKATLRPSTINRRTTGIRQLLGYAVTEGIIATNPIADMAFLEESHRETAALPRAFTEDEIKRLRSAVAKRKDYLKPLVLVALNTGARRGELFRMRWSDLLLDGPFPLLHIPKTKSGRPRDVNLNTEACKALRAWRKQKKPQPDDLVFPGADGESRLVAIKTAWATLRIKAKIPHRRFHDLRHSFVSRLLAAGVPIAVVGQLVGHSTQQMTDMYGAGAKELGGADAVGRLVNGN